MRRAVGLAAGLTAAGVAGAVATVSFTGAQAGPAPAAAPRLATAEVVRTTLATTVLTEGTLGYRPTSPVVNAVAGTYTWLPRPGQTIAAGRALYRVNDLPVILMTGAVPVWRPLEIGMTAGPDVRQLQAGLIAGGFADGLLTVPTGHFDAATTLAVERWQAAVGLPPTGDVPLGQVVFLPGRVRVGAWQVALGEQASAGQQPYVATSDRRVVIVPVSPDMPAVRVGQRVSIILPSQARTPGLVTSVGPPQVAVSGHGQAPPAVLTVTPLRPAATGTGSGVPVQVSLAIQVVRGVLAVPVSALLALAGGGYGVEVVLPSGGHRLLGVVTGVFAGGEVQVRRSGLVPGARVVVAQ